jgi:predicted nucleotidyltransferase
MRFHQPLNSILNSEVKVKILRLLCRSGGDANGRQLAKMIGASPTTAHAALKELADERVLERRSFGKTHVYRLNADAWIVRALLKPLFHEEEAFSENVWRSLAKNVRRSGLRDDILCVAVFGSVYRKEERPASDVDLFIVVRDGRQKRAVEDLMFQIDHQNILGAGLALEPHVYSLAEYQAKQKSGLLFIKNVVRAHQVIYGRRLEDL